MSNQVPRIHPIEYPLLAERLADVQEFNFPNMNLRRDGAREYMHDLALNQPEVPSVFLRQFEYNTPGKPRNLQFTSYIDQEELVLCALGRLQHAGDSFEHYDVPVGWKTTLGLVDAERRSVILRSTRIPSQLGATALVVAQRIPYNRQRKIRQSA